MSMIINKTDFFHFFSEEKNSTFGKKNTEVLVFFVDTWLWTGGEEMFGGEAAKQNWKAFAKQQKKPVFFHPGKTQFFRKKTLILWTTTTRHTRTTRYQEKN